MSADKEKIYRFLSQSNDNKEWYRTILYHALGINSYLSEDLPVDDEEPDFLDIDDEFEEFLQRNDSYNDNEQAILDFYKIKRYVFK